MNQNNSQEIKNWAILVVDDTPDNLVVMQVVLKYHGAEVYTADSAESAFEILKTVHPTVILLDIRMPKVNGIEMFKMLKENPATADIPVIAITAYAMDNDRDRFVGMGFDGYMAKPFDMFTFVPEVQQIVLKTRGTSRQK
ncbi:MAG: response regulator [Anaerolineae bacterium]|jgi:CheY-like chemotaxis protein|nr:response regulator [Anaerolineae bacterium]